MSPQPLGPWSVLVFTCFVGLFAIASLTAGATAGQVTYVAAKDAYLDVGSGNGVTKGQELLLQRRNKPVGPCEVVEVSPGAAICRSDRAAPGDRFSFAFVPPAEVAPPAAKALPPMMSPGQQRELRELVAQAPVERVKHEASTTFLAVGRTTLRQELWGVSTTPGGVFGRTSIDGYLRAAFGAAPQFFTEASFRVASDLIAPVNQRFRQGELVELYVWGLSVGVRDGLVVGELGRFYAKNVPGVLLLDGAQAGLRLFENTTEVGVYAGAIPDLITIAPTLDRLAAGTYLGVTLRPSDGVSVVPRARLGVISSPDFAYLRAELHAQTEVYWRGVGNLGGSVRTGIGGTADMLPSVDAASLDAGLGVLPELKLYGSYRYLGAPPLDLDFTLGGRVPRVGGGHDVSATTAYLVAPWLSLGASGGAALDTITDTTRAFVGPEIGLPQAFGDFGGMELGYSEELGFTKVKDDVETPGGWPGRSTWVSARLGFPFLSFMTRASYFESEAMSDWYRELGLSALVDAPVLPWLSIRARLYGQQALPALNGIARATPTAGMADLSLTGSL